MEITCTKDSKWSIGGNIKSFKNKQDLVVGVDVPDDIAEDMLRCDYAVAKSGQPRIETKKEHKEIEDPQSEGSEQDTSGIVMIDDVVKQKKSKKQKRDKRR